MITFIVGRGNYLKSVVNSHATGFTLIELLLVIATLTIVSGLGFVSLRDFSDNQVLAQATDDLVSALQSARSKAQTQVKPNTATCTNANAPLVSYLVRFTCSANSCTSYSIIPICGGSPSAAVYTKNFPADLTVTTPSSDMYFSTVTGKVVLSQNPTEVHLKGKKSETGVLIYTDGRIVKK